VSAPTTTRAAASTAPITPVFVGGKRLNNLRAKLHALRKDCLQKIAHSRISMTVDCVPDNDINEANLRQEKPTNERKSKSEQSLTIKNVFNASCSNDKLLPSSSCSYSSSDEGVNKDDGSNHQNWQDSKDDKGIFDTAVDNDNKHWIATDGNDANQDHDDAIRPDIQKLVKARAWDSSKHLRLVLSEIREDEIPVPFANMNLGWLTFQTNKISIDLPFAALCIANNMYGMATSATNAVRTVYGVHTNDDVGEVHFVLSVAEFEYKEQVFDDFVRWSPACNNKDSKTAPAQFDDNHGANRTGGEYHNGGVHSLISAARNGEVHSLISAARNGGVHSNGEVHSLIFSQLAIEEYIP